MTSNLHNVVRENPKRSTRSNPAPIPRQTRSAARKGKKQAPVSESTPNEEEQVETPQTITETREGSLTTDSDIDQPSQENQQTPQPTVRMGRLRIRYTVNPEPSTPSPPTPLSQPIDLVTTPVKRGPGRPRKYPESVTSTPPSSKRKKKADDDGITKRRKKTKDDVDTKRRKKSDDETSINDDDNDSTLYYKQTDGAFVRTHQKVGELTTQPMDIDDFEGDEDDGTIDEKGEMKITKDGDLLGGRKFKVSVFQLPSRGNTWYMLSMDPAKLLGFRDSYLFFLRNPTLKRIHATNQERDYLITHGFLPSNFRSRAITLVSARSTYKLFGSKLIVGGKKRRDDYYESSIRFNDDDLSDKGEEASGVDSTSNILSRRVYLGSKPRKIINKTNWMYQTALSSRDYNTRLKIHRREKPRFYDPHTDIEQIPQATQPTRIWVESLSQPTGLPLSSDIIIATKDPEIHFATVPRNPLSTLSAEVLEVLPPEIRQVVDNMEKEEATRQVPDDKYPIALMDGQFQFRYPIHRTRFGQDLPRVLKHSSYQVSTPPPSIFASPPADDTPYEQCYYFPDEIEDDNIQYTPGKAPPQFICGILTSTTGQPCKRGVSSEGDKCMFHKGHVDVEVTPDGTILSRTIPDMIDSALIQVRFIKL
ncbi:6286_t:CDS:2 [Funneliformis mosseae]|uniref:6286_t:CDS:1 n=1 Tax=Funneliformis mosseae TaxID=27381 RepID=A0A9N8VX54_FUNMO|nr:6286_t:CDS:2 [Funneliformis mosseae]